MNITIIVWYRYRHPNLNLGNLRPCKFEGQASAPTVAAIQLQPCTDSIYASSRTGSCLSMVAPDVLVVTVHLRRGTPTFPNSPPPVTPVQLGHWWWCCQWLRQRRQHGLLRLSWQDSQGDAPLRSQAQIRPAVSVTLGPADARYNLWKFDARSPDVKGNFQLALLLLEAQKTVTFLGHTRSRSGALIPELSWLTHSPFVAMAGPHWHRCLGRMSMKECPSPLKLSSTAVNIGCSLCANDLLGSERPQG